MKIKTILCVLGFGLAGLATSAMADEHDHFGGPGPGPQWRPNGDIHHFHEHDMMVWRGGRWFHGPHGGRAGWWWIVGGVWYFYSAPVYPYPDPYTPPEVVAAPAPAPQPGPVWYYCRHPAGYYPYVQACRHWQVVPAHP